MTKLTFFDKIRRGGRERNLTRGTLIWAVTGLLFVMFNINLHYLMGFLASLLVLSFALWTVQFAIFLLVKSFRGNAAAPLLLVIVVLGAAGLFLAHDPLSAMGDRLVFETRQPRYESLIADLKTGQPPAEVCGAQFKKCWVKDTDEPLRVGFLHTEYYDKALGYVYDPSGEYANARDWTGEERFKHAGEVGPGVPLWCTPVEPPFYRCWIS